MNRILIKNAKIVNEGQIEEKDLLIEGEIIKKIERDITDFGAKIINGEGKYLLPGIIDDQVHFREPGLTHKADIYTEAKAAVAGGITSFMEMPNTVPNVLTQDLLEQKYSLAAEKSLANFSFFMGASNDNLSEVLKTDPKSVCGVKVFMGSSTGNMLVDNETVLNRIFAEVPLIIATHCEDEQTIRDNTANFKKEYGEDIPAAFHPRIRNTEACYKSSSMAVELAKKHNARLHVLHISTAKETELFRNDIPLKEKRITAEACIHHLWFSDEDYEDKGMFIKWNPAVKTKEDRDAVFNAVLNDRIDIIATDHAPHTLEEKNQTYFNAPSGGPLVQHSLPAMLEFYRQNKISLERIIEKMCHNPAILFEIEKRGYIREGYFADLVLVDLNRPWKVSKENVLAKCGWSPFEGTTFNSSVTHTFVSGHLVYEEGLFDESKKGKRLSFDRE
ncbi:MAG: dihydroorotase [Candidatus Cyclobacteriaceae bacterium M2_1C_046]